jgi:hypothetical protein
MPIGHLPASQNARLNKVSLTLRQRRAGKTQGKKGITFHSTTLRTPEPLRNPAQITLQRHSVIEG